MSRAIKTLLLVTNPQNHRVWYKLCEYSVPIVREGMILHEPMGNGDEAFNDFIVTEPIRMWRTSHMIGGVGGDRRQHEQILLVVLHYKPASRWIKPDNEVIEADLRNHGWEPWENTKDPNHRHHYLRNKLPVSS